MNNGQDAVTSTFAFVIAVGIMMASVTAVYQATNSIADRGTIVEAEQYNLRSEADQLGLLILKSPGVIDDAGTLRPWDAAETPFTADEMVRLGLLDPNGEGIQIEKLRNLRLAPLEANATDDFANYDEVHTAMNLDNKGLDFHIRAYPTLKSAAEVESSGLRDPNLKVSYIGNVVDQDTSGVAVDHGLVVGNLECTESPAGGPSYRFSVNITNGGTTATQFFGVFDIEIDETAITRQDQTGLVPAGDTATLWVDVENIFDEDQCDSATTTEVDIIDPVQFLRTESLSAPTVGTHPADTPEDDDTFYVVTGERHYLAGETVRLSYYGDITKNRPLDLVIREGTSASGTIKYSDYGLTVPNGQGQRHVDVPIASIGGIGNYTAYLTYEDTGVVSTQRIIVLASEPNGYTPAGSTGTSVYEEDAAMAVEIEFLEKLAEQFCPAYYDDAAATFNGAIWNTRCAHFKDPGHATAGAIHALQPGDVFPDLQKELWEMADRLVEADGITPRYDVVNTIVVGSNVAHNSMTSNQFGEPLEHWVLGGGTLIVFGSPGQSTQWLQNLFHAGQTSSSGGISAPDVSHPLLSVPELLDYEEYDTSGKGWKYTGQADEHFTDVVEQGSVPVTAVSDPGDFGEGTIVLTSWLPYDLYGEGAGTAKSQGMQLMQNFLMQAYRDLFLDYGPPIPDGLPVIAAERRSFVNHEDLGPLSMDFVLFVFPQV